MRWNGPHDTPESAEGAARAACAGVASARGLPYPMPPGKSHGYTPTAAQVARATTHQLGSVRRDVNGKWWAGVPPEAEALPDRTVRVDGRDVQPARDGIDNPPSFVPDEEESDP